MAPTHELLHGLPEVAKHLGYDTRRLALAERAAANQMGHEFLMRLHCARHHSRMADTGTVMQDFCPISGRNLTLVRPLRHVPRPAPSAPTVTAAVASHGHSAPRIRPLPVRPGSASPYRNPRPLRSRSGPAPFRPGPGRLRAPECCPDRASH